jgi:hypothetical protein
MSDEVTSDAVEIDARWKYRNKHKSIDGGAKVHWPQASTLVVIVSLVVGLLASILTPTGRDELVPAHSVAPPANVPPAATAVAEPPPAAPVAPPVSLSADPRYSIALAALDDQKVPHNRSTVPSPSLVPSVVLSVTPPPPRGAELLADVQWGPDYDFERVGAAKRVSGDASAASFRFSAVQLRPPTSMSTTRVTLRALLVPHGLADAEERVALLSALGSAEFRIVAPALQVAVTHACGRPMPSTAGCSPLSLSGTVMHLLASDLERLCIEAWPASGGDPPQVLYGTVEGRRWTATAADRDASSGSYSFRFSLIEPSRAAQGAGCGDTTPLPPQSFAALNSIDPIATRERSQ